jgi:biopolymer transport protein ExbD
MPRKLLHRVVIVVFLAVLIFRLGNHLRAPRSTGFSLEVGNPAPPVNCEFDGTPLVLHISAENALRLNSEPETRDGLSGRLALILKERLQPVLYVHADPEVTVQELAEILELVRESSDKAQIRLITPGNRKYTCIDTVYGPAA